MLGHVFHLLLKTPPIGCLIPSWLFFPKFSNNGPNFETPASTPSQQLSFPAHRLPIYIYAQGDIYIYTLGILRPRGYDHWATLVYRQFGYTCYMAILDVLAIFLNGYMVCRLFGYLVILLYGPWATWLFGYTILWSLGYIAIWPKGYLAILQYGLWDIWLFGYLLHGLWVVCNFRF